jgi:hypothetical protein
VESLPRLKREPKFPFPQRRFRRQNHLRQHLLLQRFERRRNSRRELGH